MISNSTVTVIGLILGVWIIVCESVELLIEVEPPHANGSFCPGHNNIEIICTGVEVPVGLEWFINGTMVADYLFRDSKTYPRSPDNIFNTVVMVNILSANRSKPGLINITSIISGNLTNLRGSIIQWGSDNVRSDLIAVEANMPYGISIMLTAKSTVDSKLRLLRISLLWELMGPIQCQEEYVYRIAVKDNSSNEVISKYISCLAAMDQKQCMADISTPNYDLSLQYIVEVTQAILSINMSHIIELPKVGGTERSVTIGPPLNCSASCDINTYGLELIIGSVIGTFIVALILGIVLGLFCGFQLLHKQTAKQSSESIFNSNHQLKLNKGALYEEVQMNKNVMLTQNICYDTAKKI